MIDQFQLFIKRNTKIFNCMNFLKLNITYIII